MDNDADKWLEAMKAENESMHINQVWNLIPTPDSIKLIGSKWVYTRKRGADGKVGTFKVRMVAKGYTQKSASIMRKLVSSSHA